MDFVPCFWLRMVRSRGLEPPHPYRYMHLKHARLPIPPRSPVDCFDPISSNTYLKLVAVPHSGGRSDEPSEELPMWVKDRETAEAGYGRLVLAHEGDDDLQTAARQPSPQ